MKRISLSTLIGLLIAAPIIWWLHPLNAGAVGLVVTVSIACGGLISPFIIKRNENEED